MKYIGKLCILILLAAGLCGCGRKMQPYLTAEQENTAPFETEAAGADMDETQQDSGQKDSAGGTLLIYVCGEVNSPGVYELPAGSRICDAVDAAGGMTDAAGREYWNLAEPLTDGQMICFPTEEEAKKRQESAGVDAADSSGIMSDGRVNINTASLEQLMTIPGVGQTRGEAILAYRKEHGSFASAEDIINVSGIGNALYEKMKDYIAV